MLCFPAPTTIGPVLLLHLDTWGALEFKFGLRVDAP